MYQYYPIKSWDCTVCHSTHNTAFCLEDILVCCDRVPRDFHTRHSSRSLVYSHCSARSSGAAAAFSLPTFPPLDITSSWLQPQSPQMPNCSTTQMISSRYIHLPPCDHFRLTPSSRPRSARTICYATHRPGSGGMTTRPRANSRSHLPSQANTS